MEKIYEEVEREMQDTTSDDSELSQDSCKRPRLDTGSQIARMMRRSNDPEEFRVSREIHVQMAKKPESQPLRVMLPEKAQVSWVQTVSKIDRPRIDF
ncbi:hypothetical protein JYU34_021931 [Plutella xylostella]|uniref:Uncharacterized protein n=1 Tax=Plutella xylostella TaxID=51655 RepID=A0ABQ7PRP9_PLUXY|nr:hypothetical protein JYU34_021931 [Plutella xylostella]